MTTVALLVIGNEVLTGKVSEANVLPLARFLFARGARLARVVVVSDDIAEIAAEVNALRARYDIVVTSGGIGPTHDDVTVEAIAVAFGRSVVADPELVRRVHEHYSSRQTEMPNAALRLADIVEGMTLHEIEDTRWPAMQQGNVFVLPGVPSLFARQLVALSAVIRSAPFMNETIFTTVEEPSLADFLTKLQADFSDVQVGVYLAEPGAAYKTRVTFDGVAQERVSAAAGSLVAAYQAQIVERAAAS